MNKNRHRNKSMGMENWRAGALLSVVFLFFTVIFLRLVQIQIFSHEFYSAMAQDQHELYEKIVSERGDIYIKDNAGEGLYPVAINKQMNLVYAVPRQIKEKDKKNVSEKVSRILGLEYQEVLAEVSKPDDAYEPIKHKASNEEVELLKKEDLDGIGIVPESFRYYPGGSLASNVIGFVGYSGNEKKGQYGIEGYCNADLEGETGFMELEKDAFGNWISFGSKNLQSSKDGDDVVLTIDYTVQYLVEQKLKEAVEKFEAEEGGIIIMDPETGAIIAMAQYPNYDLNEYSKVDDMSVYLNKNIHDVYEPGSVEKTITMAIGIDMGKISPSTTFVDSGRLLIDGWTIQNSDYLAHGEQTMTEALEKSLNTASVFVQQQVDKKVFYDYLVNFGLNSKTGIELGGEAQGNLANLDVKNDINYATASFGQGISVTPLEILVAISSFANDGKLMKPYIIDSFVDERGNERKNSPVVVRQVVSPRTANLVAAMMVSVVKNGHSKAAAVKGYKFAGKTGTAQIPSKDKKGYEEGRTIHTYIGFGPMPDPKFSILVKLNAPKARFAESTAVPVAGAISEELVKYYNLAPTEE